MESYVHNFSVIPVFPAFFQKAVHYLLQTPDVIHRHFYGMVHC